MKITRERKPDHPKWQAGGRRDPYPGQLPDTGYGIFIENMLNAAA